MASPTERVHPNIVAVALVNKLVRCPRIRSRQIRQLSSKVGGHLRLHWPSLGSSLSSTWGRADQLTFHDSTESGAFCFAPRLPSASSLIREINSLMPS